MIAYYLAPWISAFAVGDGRFSLTNPSGGRPVNLSRCLIYGQWNLTPNSSLTITGTRGGAGKSLCFTRADQDAATHTLITADPAVFRLPFSNTDLGNEFQSLSSSLKTSITDKLESQRLDSTWIQPTTLAREIVRYALCVLIGAKEMGADYPETNLANPWNTLTVGQRNRIKTYLGGWNVVTSDIKNDTPIRTVITKIGRIARGAIMLGPDTF